MPRFERTFFVSQALRVRPNPDLWTIKPPGRLTSDQLVIEFDRPFDYELLHSGIVVKDEDGHIIPGTATVKHGENAWHFNRQGNWKNKQIQLAIDTRLEDVAGNNFRELLDHSVNTVVQNINQKKITLDLKPSSY